MGYGDERRDNPVRTSDVVRKPERAHPHKTGESVSQLQDERATEKTGPQERY